MDLKIALAALVVCFLIALGFAYAIVGDKNLQLLGILAFAIMFVLLFIVVAIAKAAGGELGG